MPLDSVGSESSLTGSPPAKQACLTTVDRAIMTTQAVSPSSAAQGLGLLNHPSMNMMMMQGVNFNPLMNPLSMLQNMNHPMAFQQSLTNQSATGLPASSSASLTPPSVSSPAQIVPTQSSLFGQGKSDAETIDQNTVPSENESDTKPKGETEIEEIQNSDTGSEKNLTQTPEGKNTETVSVPEAASTPVTPQPPPLQPAPHILAAAKALSERQSPTSEIAESPKTQEVKSEIKPEINNEIAEKLSRTSSPQVAPCILPSVPIRSREGSISRGHEGSPRVQLPKPSLTPPVTVPASIPAIHPALHGLGGLGNLLGQSALGNGLNPALIQQQILLAQQQIAAQQQAQQQQAQIQQLQQALAIAQQNAAQAQAAVAQNPLLNSLQTNIPTSSGGNSAAAQQAASILATAQAQALRNNPMIGNPHVINPLLLNGLTGGGSLGGTPLGAKDALYGAKATAQQAISAAEKMYREARGGMSITGLPNFRHDTLQQVPNSSDVLKQLNLLRQSQNQ